MKVASCTSQALITVNYVGDCGKLKVHLIGSKQDERGKDEGNERNADTFSFQSFARGLSAITGLTAWPACACVPTSVPRAAGSQCAAAMPKRTRRSASCRGRPAGGIPNCQSCTWYSTATAANDSPSRRSVRSSFLFFSFQFSIASKDSIWKFRDFYSVSYQCRACCRARPRH